MAGRLTSPRTLVVGSLNVRGCSSIESKRSEIGCMFGRRGMDVLALCETKMKGKGEVAFGEVTGRVSGVERGRAREGVALLLSEWMENKVVEWKEVSSRLMWVRVRMGRECWAFVSAYGPGCERSEEERDEFWNDLTRCVDGLTTRNYVVVLGDLNARVGDGEVEGVVGKYGVPGENESGERLLNMCVEQELVIGNSFFKKKEINKYTWIRVANGRVIERALMDYVLITKRMVGRLKDVHVFRGVAAGMSDHFLVEAEVVVAKEWGSLRSMTGVSRLDRVRNEVVRARTGVRRELAARVDVNVLRWFGHVERMDNERLLKKVMNAKVDGRSARGRPRFGWMDGVKRALNDRRMDIKEASERARNRNEWRMIVTQF